LKSGDSIDWDMEIIEGERVATVKKSKSGSQSLKGIVTIRQSEKA
jgi:hypothetical protein